MKNYEKYAEEIKEYKGPDFCDSFVIPHIVKSNKYCMNTSCNACKMRQMIWLLEEYEEPEVDWSKVEVDTPILVRDSEEDRWHRAHFAKYEDGEIYAWVGIGTSWTSGYTSMWKYAKLAESEQE